MNKTAIEWTDLTWNPLQFRELATGKTVWHCEKVSPGCTNCYAEAMAKRFVRGGRFAVQDRDLYEPFLNAKELQAPLREKAPAKIFVGDMTDLFGPWVTDAMLDRIFAVAAWAQHHTFQFLTKRPERMAAYFNDPSTEDRINEAMCDICALRSGKLCGYIADDCSLNGVSLPLRNVWLGTSAENQETFDERVRHLRRCPAAVRFISYEPALGAIDMKEGLRISWQCSGCAEYFSGPLQKICPKCGRDSYWCGSHAFNPPGGQTGSAIHWVICGGESGPGARPMNPAWARSVRDQCAAAGVPFHFKQWGEWIATGQAAADGSQVALTHAMVQFHRWEDGSESYRIGKRAAGHLLDGVEHYAFPEPAR